MASIPYPPSLNNITDKPTKMAVRSAYDDLNKVLGSLAAGQAPKAKVRARAPGGQETTGASLVGALAQPVIGGSGDSQLVTIGTSPGSVTSITAGTGLGASPSNPITGSGTIDLEDTAVSPGSYTHPSITVDAQGRLTGADDLYTVYTIEFDSGGVLIEHQCTLAGGIPTFSAAGAGDYNFNLTNAFAGSVWISALLTKVSSGSACFVQASKVDQDNISVKSWDETLVAADPRSSIFLEIRVYP